MAAHGAGEGVRGHRSILPGQRGVSLWRDDAVDADVVGLARQGLEAGVPHLAREGQRDDRHPVTDIDKRAVVPAAALTKPRAGTVNGESRHDDDVGVVQRLCWEKRGRRLWRSPRRALDEVSRPSVHTPPALQAVAEQWDEHTHAPRVQRLDKRQRARLVRPRRVDGHATGHLYRLKSQHLLAQRRRVFLEATLRALLALTPDGGAQLDLRIVWLHGRGVNRHGAIVPNTY